MTAQRTNINLTMPNFKLLETRPITGCQVHAQFAL
jgi:hypothetical protein